VRELRRAEPLVAVGELGRRDDRRVRVNVVCVFLRTEHRHVGDGALAHLAVQAGQQRLAGGGAQVLRGAEVAVPASALSGGHDEYLHASPNSSKVVLKRTFQVCCLRTVSTAALRMRRFLASVSALNCSAMASYSPRG